MFKPVLITLSILAASTLANANALVSKHCEQMVQQWQQLPQTNLVFSQAEQQYFGEYLTAELFNETVLLPNLEIKALKVNHKDGQLLDIAVLYPDNELFILILPINDAVQFDFFAYSDVLMQGDKLEFSAPNTSVAGTQLTKKIFNGVPRLSDVTALGYRHEPSDINCNELETGMNTAIMMAMVLKSIAPPGLPIAVHQKAGDIAYMSVNEHENRTRGYQTLFAKGEDQKLKVDYMIKADSSAVNLPYLYFQSFEAANKRPDWLIALEAVSAAQGTATFTDKLMELELSGVDVEIY